jgi:hypothetical protein
MRPAAFMARMCVVIWLDHLVAHNYQRAEIQRDAKADQVVIKRP